MGSEDIVNLCASLSLTEREGPVYTLQDGLKAGGVQKMALCLAGKILSPDLVNREAFRVVISKIWRLRRGVEVENVTNNIFTFHFQLPEDRRKVSNVPLLCMMKEIVEFLGSLIGKVREIDTGATGDCIGKFLRVRVAIETSKPLRRFLRVDVLGDGEETVMPIHYECLPNFCFHCGMLDHTVRCCQETIGPDYTVVSDLQYGAWLRATRPVKALRQRGWGNTSNDGRYGGFRRAGNLVDEVRRYKQQAVVACGNPVALGGVPKSQVAPSSKQVGKFSRDGYVEKGEKSGKVTDPLNSNVLGVGEQVSGSVPLGVINVPRFFRDSFDSEKNGSFGGRDSGFLNSYMGGVKPMVESDCGLGIGPVCTPILKSLEAIVGPVCIPILKSPEAIVGPEKARKGKRVSGKRIVNWKKAARNVFEGRGKQVSEVCCGKRKDAVVVDAFNDGSKKPRNDSSETCVKEKMQNYAVKLNNWNQAKRRAMRAEISKLKKELAKATEDVRSGYWRACLKLIARCLRVLKLDEMEILCVMFWRLWFKRNQLVYSAVPTCGEDVFEWVAGYVEEFRMANQTADQSPRFL
ncbi:hypothetical protein EZV62_022436 [Acer yangbiense]|uniref:Zinc knuckle CX2CX4HX4C domain-containing protein n=1 Tax=Acer yangbiense TaxID=1000413 RepID=A0A5C7H8D7_9ROSI|nr:hypothetical protein EZV62_022436 [Acer yangbiense]